MKRLGVYILMLTLTLCVSVTVKAGIKDVSWVTKGIEKAVNKIKPLKVSMVNSNDSGEHGYWSLDEHSNHYIIPIEVTKPGKLTLEIKTDGLKDGKMSVGLYTDIKLSKEVGKSKSLEGKPVSNDYTVKPGVYYLAFEKTGESKGKLVKGIMSAYLVRSDKQKIDLNKSYIGYIGGKKESLVYSFKTKRAGYIEIRTDRKSKITVYGKDGNAVITKYNLNRDNKFSVSIPINGGEYKIALEGDKGNITLQSSFKKGRLLSNTVDSIKIGDAKKFILIKDSVKNHQYRLKLEVDKPTKLRLVTKWLCGQGDLNIGVVYTGDNKIYNNEFKLNSTSKTETTIKLAGDGMWDAGTYYLVISTDANELSSAFSVSVETIE